MAGLRGSLEQAGSKATPSRATRTFVDLSAVVKPYADEHDHELIRQLNAIVVAQIGRVEMQTALWPNQHMGVLSARRAQILTADFGTDYFGSQGIPRTLQRSSRPAR